MLYNIIFNYLKIKKKMYKSDSFEELEEYFLNYSNEILKYILSNNSIEIISSRANICLFYLDKLLSFITTRYEYDIIKYEKIDMAWATIAALL